MRFFVLRCLFRCRNVSEAVTCRHMSMARPQNSVNSSTIYPRLDSVDLSDETAECDAALKELNFKDHRDAYQFKTTWEIIRALTILSMCSVNYLVDNSLSMMKWIQRASGVRGLRIFLKPVLYNQFVGGESTTEIRACVRRLAETGMRAMLAATMEEDVGEGGDENVYDSNCERILESIEIVTEEDTRSPMIQLKLSGLLSADLLAALGNIYTTSPDKVRLISSLSQEITGQNMHEPQLDVLGDKKKMALSKALERFKRICLAAQRKAVKVLVDAEYTYLNPGLSALTLAAVAAFNRDSSIVWNTYQCYLKNAQCKVEEEMKIILEDFGCHFGAKVVRGAYMVQEINRAEKLQIESPVCESFAATSETYDYVISFLLNKNSQLGLKCQFIIASHNEESIKLAVKRMDELKIDKQSDGICFGQLYGMCDYISNPLANAGYAVYKSIPFGTIDEVLPYIARRAIENKSVIEGGRKELSLLKKELSRRTLGTFKFKAS
ncbi:putative proline dehydrogenase 2, partial [Stegodyphus mimosarum]